MSEVNAAMLIGCKLAAEVAYWATRLTAAGKEKDVDPRELAFYGSVRAFFQIYVAWFSNEDLTTDLDDYITSYEIYRTAFYAYAEKREWQTPFAWPATPLSGSPVERAAEKKRDEEEWQATQRMAKSLLATLKPMVAEVQQMAPEAADD